MFVIKSPCECVYVFEEHSLYLKKAFLNCILPCQRSFGSGYNYTVHHNTLGFAVSSVDHHPRTDGRSFGCISRAAAKPHSKFIPSISTLVSVYLCFYFAKDTWVIILLLLNTAVHNFTGTAIRMKATAIQLLHTQGWGLIKKSHTAVVNGEMWVRNEGIVVGCCGGGGLTDEESHCCVILSFSAYECIYHSFSTILHYFNFKSAVASFHRTIRGCWWPVVIQKKCRYSRFL